MQLLDALNAVFYFYVLLFALALIAFFAGVRMAYVAWATRNTNLMRKAKFVLLFATIALLCIGIVSFFETGKLPLE